MATETKVIVANEYRQISVGLNGVFVNRGVTNAYMLERAEQPTAQEEGDPMVTSKRYSYQLAPNVFVWAKSATGSLNIGVTQNDN